jgi:hypothetical protein
MGMEARLQNYQTVSSECSVLVHCEGPDTVVLLPTWDVRKYHFIDPLCNYKYFDSLTFSVP